MTFMRKGVLKLIENLHKRDIFDGRYEQWLSDSALSLQELNVVNKYYLGCLGAGQEPDAVFSEIRHYDDEIWRYELDAYFLPIVLYCDRENGDVLIGMYSTKAIILNKCMESLDKGISYNALFRYFVPHFIGDRDLLDLVFELTDKFTDRWKRNENEPFTRPLFANEFFSILRSTTMFKEKCFLYDGPCEAESINDLLWIDLLKNRKLSVLYKAWSNGYVIDLSGRYINNGECIHYSKQFEKQFLDFINGMNGNKSDNLMMYFAFVDGAIATQDYHKHWNFDSEMKIRVLEFNYNQALDDLNAENICYQVMARMRQSIPDIMNNQLFIYDKALLHKMADVCDGNEFSVSSVSYSLSFFLSESGCLNIYVYQYRNVKVCYEKDKGRVFKGDRCSAALSFFVSRDNRIYYRHQRNPNTQPTKSIFSWYPLSMKTLCPFMSCELLVQFFMTLADITGNMFLKDVINDMKVCGFKFLVPITYEDTVKYHNKAEYFRAAYKNAGMIRWNYNKNNMNLSYLVIKALNKVSISDYGILQNASIDMLDHVQIMEYGQKKIRNAVMFFLAGFYIAKDPACADTALDYVEMCLDAHRDVILHYSVKRMTDEHDHFMDAQSYADYKRHVKVFHVPKDSKFKALRKMLPDTFEWVKTRKRLINESIEMHHCVWSYYNKIEADRCAIYSFFDEFGYFDTSGNNEPKRYTIEFMYNKRTKKYYVRQIQTKYNKYGGAKLGTYINELLLAL